MRKILASSLRGVHEGRDKFLDGVQMAASDCQKPAEVFLALYQGLTEPQQAEVSFDDVCAAGGIVPSDLMARVVKAAMDHSLNVGDMTAAAMHPRIVRQTAKSALRIGGKHAEIAQKDRLVMLQKTRFAPVPRGASVTVNTQVSANAKAAAAAASQPSVPSFFEDVGSLQGPADQVRRDRLEDGE